MRRAAAAAALRVPESATIDSWRSRVRRLAHTLALDAPGRYVAYMTHLNGLRRDRLYTDEYRALIGGADAAEALVAPMARVGRSLRARHACSMSTYRPTCPTTC